MGNALSKGISEKGSIGDWLLRGWRLFGYGSPAEFIEAFNKGQIIVHAKNSEDAIRIMQNVIKEVPLGLQSAFFKAVPVTIALIDTYMSQNKLDTLAKDLLATNPLYATIKLFVE